MDIAWFEQVVDDALAEVPDELWARAENLHVVVEEFDEREPDLYGVYDGAPIGEYVDFPAAPNRIIVFRGPLLKDFGADESVLRAQIRTTVLHELGHHFGMDEQQLADLGFQ